MERDKLNLRNHTGATERYQVKPVMEKCPLLALMLPEAAEWLFPWIEKNATQPAEEVTATLDAARAIMEASHE